MDEIFFVRPPYRVLHAEHHLILSRFDFMGDMVYVFGFPAHDSFHSGVHAVSPTLSIS